MKLYSVSLLWGVATEAMEYEEQAEIRCIHFRSRLNHFGMRSPLYRTQSDPQQDGRKDTQERIKGKGKQSRTRLERLEFVGFGSTLGGILGR